MTSARPAGPMAIEQCAGGQQPRRANVVPANIVRSQTPPLREERHDTEPLSVRPDARSSTVARAPLSVSVWRSR